MVCKKTIKGIKKINSPSKERIIRWIRNKLIKYQWLASIIMGLIILLFFYLYFTDNHLIHTLNCNGYILLKHWSCYIGMNSEIRIIEIII